MTRKEELEKIVYKNGSHNNVTASELIDEIVFLEERMKELRKLPFIKVNPKNPAQQKVTPASKQYKEILQQYNNSLRLLLRISGDIGEAEEESPLWIWAKKMKDSF